MIEVLPEIEFAGHKIVKFSFLIEFFRELSYALTTIFISNELAFTIERLIPHVFFVYHVNACGNNYVVILLILFIWPLIFEIKKTTHRQSN